MSEQDIADALRQWANELNNLANELEPKLQPRRRTTLDMDDFDPPSETLLRENKHGYTLHQCLHNMLKMWDEDEPGWPIHAGLERQAKQFKLPLETIYEAIRENPSLHKRFRAYRSSGYPF